MPKMKTKRAAAKRFHVTGTGKFMRNKSGRRHLLEWKSKKQKRGLRGSVVVSTADERRVRDMLPYAR